ncbi:hypothetical protein IQ07DRAFT_488217, partial [Pyrenochaeta sp. DS3sAY3a]
SPEASPKRPRSVHRAFHGHQMRIATKCSHDIHPSASPHTPRCPDCIMSQAKAKFCDAQEILIAEGGLKPAVYMRDRWWNQARRKYEIAEKRLADCRKKGQLLWEREQTWDDAHDRYDSQRGQATAPGYQSPSECPVCVSLVASYPTKAPKMDKTEYVPWWEQRSKHARKVRTVARMPSVKPCYQPRLDGQRHKGSQMLREIIESHRELRYAERTWETRYKTESAVRRKHSLGDETHFEAEFWDSPLSGALSLRNFQHNQDYRRIAERRARGNAPRPKPPRSSLSHSEVSEEVQVDDRWLETMREREEQEDFERRTRKVGEEVGYLYFVGAADGMYEWREDYLRSDQQLVERKYLPTWDGWGSEHDSD